MRTVRCCSRLLGEGVSARGRVSAQGGGVCPGGVVSARGMSAPVHAGIHPPCERNDWQTPVKILPCRNFVADCSDLDSNDKDHIKMATDLNKFWIFSGYILPFMAYSHWQEPRLGQGPGTNGLYETVSKLSHYTRTRTGGETYRPLIVLIPVPYCEYTITVKKFVRHMVSDCCKLSRWEVV